MNTIKRRMNFVNFATIKTFIRDTLYWIGCLSLLRGSGIRFVERFTEFKSLKLQSSRSVKFIKLFF